MLIFEEMVEVKGRHNSLNTVEWDELQPDDRNTWLIPENADEFLQFMPMGSKETKRAKGRDAEAIFKLYSLGVSTNRDEVVYDFDRQELVNRVQGFIESYNAEIDRYRRANQPNRVDDFVRYDRIKWSRNLKDDLRRGKYAEYSDAKARICLYRPFSKRFLFYDSIVNEEPRLYPKILPAPLLEQENRVIALTMQASGKPFMTLMTNLISDLHLVGAGSGTVCFPFYTYDEDGSNRRENITDWALAQFRARYGETPGVETDSSASTQAAESASADLPDGSRTALASGDSSALSKWDIFYYVYALLHHPDYRTRYADNLKRELPRIPFVPTAADFWAFAEAGKKLADLHLNYESIPPYPLEYAWTPGKPVSYRVEKMRLAKDSPLQVGEGSGVRSLKFNDSLTLRGIPAAAFDYRLGNRSALDWVIDQYRVKSDARSGITSDPNSYSDDEQYIVKLVGRVVSVSVQTVEIVRGLAGVNLTPKSPLHPGEGT